MNTHTVPPTPNRLDKELHPRRKTRPVPGCQNLTDEILMLRILIRRLKRLAEEVDDPVELRLSLDILGKTCTRLGSLIRLQRQLGAQQAGSLEQALADLLDELGQKMAVPEDK
jgi:hypothetical protein